MVCVEWSDADTPRMTRMHALLRVSHGAADQRLTQSACSGRDPDQVEHDGRLITVFSAPNYCDQMGNKGAFVRFNGKDMVRAAAPCSSLHALARLGRSPRRVLAPALC